MGLFWAPLSLWAQDTPAPSPAQAHALRQIIATMEAEAAEMAPQVEAARKELADLTGQVTKARSDLAASRKDRDRIADETAGLETRREEQQTALETVTGTLKEQTDQNKQASAKAEELARKIADLTSAETAQTARLEQVQADITAATTRLDQDIPARQADLAALQTQLADLTQQRDSLQAQKQTSDVLTRKIAAQQAQSEGLDDQLRTLTSQLAALTQERDAAQEPPAPDPAPEAAESPVPRRSSAQVSAALTGVPGLPDAPAQRSLLRDRLIAGDCPTDALRQVQDPINRQSLLILLDRLGGC